MAAAALHRSPALLLRLRHRLLLPEPARLISSRAEPLFHPSPSSATANASSPPAAPPPPLSTGSTAPSMHTERPRSPPFFPDSSCYHPPSSRPTLPAPSILPQRGHCADPHIPIGLLAAVKSGCGPLPVLGNAGMLQIGAMSRQGFLPQHTQKRKSSSTDPQSQIGLLAAVKSGCGPLPMQGKARLLQIGAVSSQGFLPQHTQKRMPSSSCKSSPVSHLLNLDDTELLKLEWEDPIEYLKKCPPLKDSRENPLISKVAAYANKPDLHFSEVGAWFVHEVIYLAFANSNGGYCVKGAFKKENILVCPRLKRVRFRKVEPVMLDTDCPDFNRAASYTAAAALMQDILEEVYEVGIMAKLSEEATDLFNKMFVPSHERLIIHHSSLLSEVARGWFYLRVYQIVFQIILGLEDTTVSNHLKEALAMMAYTDTEVTVEDIIPTHPLLNHIELSKRRWQMVDESWHDSAEDLPKAETPKKRHIRLGKKVIALARHTIQHAFDSDSKNVLSNSTSKDQPKTLWPYSLEQVVDMLKTIFPLLIPNVQEVFLKEDLWKYLKMEHFWERQLEWMGSIQEPTTEEQDAISKVSYGKRRINAKKFGRPYQRVRHNDVKSKKGSGPSEKDKC